MSSLGDVVGIFLAFFLLLAAGIWGQKKGGRNAALASMLVVGSHLLIAYLSVSEIAFSAGADNMQFFEKARDLSIGWIEYNWYLPSSTMWANFLSFPFLLFGASIWLGYVANALFFFLAITQLWRFLEDIGSPFKVQTILLFGLMPASLLFANFMLRESFQILMLIVSIRHLERYRKDGGLRPLVLALCALIPFGAIHNGFFLFAPVALLTAVFGRILVGPVGVGSNMNKGAAIFLAVLMMGVVFGAATTFSDNSRVDQVMSGDIDVAHGLQRSVERGSRTTFPWAPGQGMVSTIVFLPLLLFQFLFAPIVPMMVSSAADAVAVLETGVRIALLFGVWRLYRAMPVDDRRMILFMMALYVLFCAMAAIGTTTVGTAMRHSLKMLWLLAALGVPGLLLGRLKRIRARPAWQSVMPLQTRMA